MEDNGFQSLKKEKEKENYKNKKNTTKLRHQLTKQTDI